MNNEQKISMKDYIFKENIKEKDLPSYCLDYTYEDEVVLSAYKTTRDYGIFTNKKMVLFDHTTTNKRIITTPYNAVSSVIIDFKSTSAELYVFLKSGNNFVLKFTDMAVMDKIRLRLLYTAISRVVANQELPNELKEQLIFNKIDSNF